MNSFLEWYDKPKDNARFCGEYYHWAYTEKDKFRSKDWFCDACMKRMGAWNLLLEGKIQ